MSIFSALWGYLTGAMQAIANGWGFLTGHSLTGALLWAGGAVAVTVGIWLYERKAGQS